MRTPHNSIYDTLQKEYFKKRDEKTLTKMYKIAKEVSYNYLKRYCYNKGIILSNIKEMAHDSALYTIDQYLRKPGFRIRKISAYVHFGVMKTLFRDKDAEQREVSYEGIIESGWDKRLSILNTVMD
jgi:hypothetical protein